MDARVKPAHDGAKIEGGVAPMQKWNMIIDVAECTNCNLCTLATMDEYVGNEWPGYTKPMPRHGHKWINILQKERGQIPMIDIAYVPTMCNHCDDAPCIAKAPDAIKKREVAQAWPFDAHLIDDGWQQTRGHQSCPTGAMRAISAEDADMARMAREEGLEVMRPELGSKPRVYYRNLWRYSKCFIGGSISSAENGLVDCVEGASVRLLRDGALVAQATSDNYGDFKFDKLDENSGNYTVEISANGRTRKVDAKLGASVNLGEIRL
jgi:Fe-S-cluster-containing dehydrogenase component